MSTPVPSWLSDLPEHIQRYIMDDWSKEENKDKIKKVAWNSEPNFFSDNEKKSKIIIEITANIKYELFFTGDEDATYITHFCNDVEYNKSTHEGEEVHEKATNWIKKFFDHRYECSKVDLLPVMLSSSDFKINASSVCLRGDRDSEGKFLPNWLRLFLSPIEDLTIMSCKDDAKFKLHEKIKSAKKITIVGSTNIKYGIIDIFEEGELIIVDTEKKESLFEGQYIADMLNRWTLEYGTRRIVLYSRQFPQNFWNPIGQLLKEFYRYSTNPSFEPGEDNTFDVKVNGVNETDWTLKVNFKNHRFEADITYIKKE